MINELIVRKALDKAIKNGFKELDTTHLHFDQVAYGLGSNEIMATIFSHYFAKAFWGEDPHNPDPVHEVTCVVLIPEWQYHLRQMVIEEEPIKYLENFL